MRAGEVASQRVTPSHTRGAYRRRRLRRGVECWALDLNLCRVRTRRVAVITLTVKDADPLAARYRVRDFWAKVRRRWLGTLYFCWLELQARGAVHYHAVWLNPPHRRRVDLVDWVQRAWGSDRTQVRFRPASTGVEDEVAYALSYSKKMGRKRYQQLYDNVPRELRTFMCNRLEIPPDEVKQHLEKDVWEFIPKHSYRGEFVEERLELRAHLEHVIPPGGYCSALDHRRAWASRAPPRLHAPPLTPVQRARLELQHISRSREATRLSIKEGAPGAQAAT